MHAIKTYLDAIDPRLFFALIALVAWTVVGAWRKYAPASFERIPPTVQALPAILVGAVAAAPAGAGSLKETFINATLGAFSGLAAIGTHHALKAGKEKSE